MRNGIRNIVKFEIQKNIVALSNQFLHKSRPRRDEQLLSHLEAAQRRPGFNAKAGDKLPGGIGIRVIQRDDYS
jgi:hypothetical protein